MNLGEEQKELQVEPLQWPAKAPEKAVPAPVAVPEEAPVAVD